MIKKTQLGFSIIEIIVFIVVMAIIGVTILISYTRSVTGLYVVHPQTVAIKAASSCMEYYLGQRYISGYSAATLTCPSSSAATPAFCTSVMPTGYNVSTTCETDLTDPTHLNYKIFTVTVSGLGNATLSLLLAKY